MARLPKQSRKQKSFPSLSAEELNRLALHVATQLTLKYRRIRFTPTSGHSLIYIPRMDIVDDPNSPRMVAMFELPGVRYDEVSVTVRHGILRVCGKRVPRKLQELCANTERHGISNTDGAESNASGPDTGSAGADVSIQVNTPLSIDSNSYPVQEMRYGYFKRELKLPKGTKEGDMTATLREGLLIVAWPRCSSESSNGASEP